MLSTIKSMLVNVMLDKGQKLTGNNLLLWEVLQEEVGDDPEDRTLFLGDCFQEIIRKKKEFTDKTQNEEEDLSSGAVRNE